MIVWPADVLSRQWLIFAQVHFDPSQVLETTAQARKLMHRFTEVEVEWAMDDVEQRKE
jgi:hypothetical protein